MAAAVMAAAQALPTVIDADAVVAALSGKRFALENEKRLQAEIDTVLQEAFAGFVYREYRLGVTSIIDFVVVNHPGFGATGIEVKIGGSAADIHRQLVRYAEQPDIASLVLVTAKAVALPQILKPSGKRLRVVNLGRAWL